MNVVGFIGLGVIILILLANILCERDRENAKYSPYYNPNKIDGARLRDKKNQPEPTKG